MSTILIIDSQPSGLRELEETLRAHGHVLKAAGTSRDAKTLVAAETETGTLAKDVCILDWQLPDGDGIELLEWLRARPGGQELEVIVESADLDPDRIRRGLELGVFYYLGKPVENSRLFGLVRAALTSQQLEQTLVRMTNEIQDCFALLSRGSFEIRRVVDAELLSAHIGSACGDPQIGIGILELLVNGIEHGNLGITYEEKSQLLADGTYEQEIARRSALEENRGKKVDVDLCRTGNSLDIVIQDAGPGFDYARYLSFDKERFFDAHGRGVLLASAVMQLEFFDPGNRIRARIPLAAEPQSASS